MNQEFLDGIDDHFHRLMKLYGNGKRNGKLSSRWREDPLVVQIIEELQDCPDDKKREALDFIRSLRHGVK